VAKGDKILRSRELYSGKKLGAKNQNYLDTSILTSFLPICKKYLKCTFSPFAGPFPLLSILNLAQLLKKSKPQLLLLPNVVQPLENLRSPSFHAWRLSDLRRSLVPYPIFLCGAGRSRRRQERALVLLSWKHPLARAHGGTAWQANGSSSAWKPTMRRP
jgi:hypothetical protein